MTIIPWRVKNFLSRRFPLLYHLAVNLGTRGNSSEHWDKRLAALWENPRMYWPTLNKLIASLTNPDERIIDIGCGNGGMLRYLKGLGYRDLSGLDGSAYGVNRLRAEGITMHLARLPKVPLADNDYDVVITSAVLEHVIRRRTFIKELRRILKPQGRAYIFVPDNALGPIDDPEHCIMYTEPSLRRFLKRYFREVVIDRTRDVNDTTPLLFATVRK